MIKLSFFSKNDTPMVKPPKQKSEASLLLYGHVCNEQAQPSSEYNTFAIGMAE